MLDIHRLTKRYGARVVLDALDAGIPRAEYVALIGPNGVGKSTLVGCICGTIRPDSGNILLNTMDIAQYPELTKSQIGVCFQETVSDRFAKVFDSVRWCAMYHGLSAKQSKAHTAMILDKLELYERRNEICMHLSGGMKKRLQLAYAMVHEPKLIMLDEPTAGVDLEQKEALHQILFDYKKEAKTILLTSHDLNEISLLSDRALFLKDGKIMANLTHHQFHQDLERTYRQLYMGEL